MNTSTLSKDSKKQQAIEQSMRGGATHTLQNSSFRPLSSIPAQMTAGPLANQNSLQSSFQKSHQRQTTQQKPTVTISMSSFKPAASTNGSTLGRTQKSYLQQQQQQQQQQKQQKTQVDSSGSESESESEDDESSAVNDSMLSEKSTINECNSRKNRVLNFISTLCEAELFLEKLRQKVCSFSDFQPYSVYQRFNRFSRKELLASDFEAFLKTVDASTSETPLTSFMSFFDRDRSQSLSFNEFQASVITTEDESLCTKVTTRAVFRVSSEQYLSLNLEVSLGKLFTQYMEYFQKNEEYRKEQEDNFDYDEFMAAFNFLDRNGKGEIQDSDIIDFLASQGFMPSDAISRRVIRAFKGPNADNIEQDPDYIIGYDEFGNPIYKNTIDKLKFVRFNVTKNMDKDAVLRYIELNSAQKVKIPVRKLRSLEVRREWMEVFKQRVEAEKDIEYCKQDLVMQKDFSAHDMFTLINSDQNEYISVEEFVESLEELGVKPHKEEIYLFFRRHAKNKIKGMRKREFKRMILPNQHMYDKVAKGRVKVSKDGSRIRMKDILDAETIRRFKKLMMALLKFELKIESISASLAKIKNFSYEEFFELLDPDNKEYFSYQNLSDVFVEHGINITEKDLSFLFKRLDCKEKDEKISYSEFINEVHPHLARNLTSKIFSEAQRFKQEQSMANIIDSKLNLQSRPDMTTGNTHKNNFSIHSLGRIATDI